MVTLSLEVPPSLLEGPRGTTSMSNVTVDPEVTAGSWFVISFPFTNTAPETFEISTVMSHFPYILTCNTMAPYFFAGKQNWKATLPRSFLPHPPGCNNCRQEKETCDRTKDFNYTTSVSIEGG